MRIGIQTQKAALGFTLIEVVFAIIVLGILAATILLPFTEALQNTAAQHQNRIALEVAKSRLEMILGQKKTQGFANYTDPCPGPAICTPPAGYNVSVNITDWLGSGYIDEILVTVSGEGDASLTTLVANYE